MSEKRMLVLPSEVVDKINANRGDMGQAEFITYLIDTRLKPGAEEHSYATREDLQELEQGIKDLLRNFLEFVVSYGMELGHKPNNSDDMEALSSKLHGLMAAHAERSKPKK